MNPANVRRALIEATSIVGDLERAIAADPSLADELNPAIAQLKSTWADLDEALKGVGA